MQPWPTAYTFLHRPGKEPVRVLVYRVRKLGPVEGLAANPSAVGSVLSLDPDRLIIPAFDGSSVIEVLELQPAGKKRMTAAEFLRGHPAGGGGRFGPPDLQV
jgi:methionyl-tRNA formyltransferase